MWMIIAFVGGLIIGGIIATITIQSRSIGAIRVDRSDPDDVPYLFLELKRDVPNFCNKKYVTCKVKVENFISHE